MSTSQLDGQEYSAADFTEPAMVEWEVVGLVDGERMMRFERATNEDAAEDAFREHFEGCVVEIVETLPNPYQW